MPSPPTPEDLASRFGLSSSSVSSFLKGEVVVHELDASSDKDLSLLVVTVVGAPMEKAWEFLQTERVPEIQTATLAAGSIDTANPSLDEMDLDENMVKSLLKNPFMSKAEAKRLQEGSKNGKGVEVYKQILVERSRAYWDGGLKGIVPYDGKGRDPKTDLGNANEAILKLVVDPEIRSEILATPSKSQNPSVHSLQWAIQKGNDQAAPVLNHMIRMKREYGFISVTRRFYCGADYDSSQIVAGVVPTADGRSAVFYTNRTFTSAVAGFGGSAKRSIGRKMMKSKLVETMTKAQKALAN